MFSLQETKTCYADSVALFYYCKFIHELPRYGLTQSKMHHFQLRMEQQMHILQIQ